MKDLNSVLIEGVLNKEPVFTGATIETSTCVFPISVTTGRANTHLIRVKIHTYGRLAKTCNETLHKGRGVRVVGLLAEEKGKHFLIAEHIEFKPPKTVVVPARLSA